MGADPVIKTIIMADPVPVEMKSQVRHLTPHVRNVTGGKNLYKKNSSQHTYIATVYTCMHTIN